MINLKKIYQIIETHKTNNKEREIEMQELEGKLVEGLDRNEIFDRS